MKVNSFVCGLFFHISAYLPDLEINYLPNLKFVILTETIGFISVDYCIDNEYYSMYFARIWKKKKRNT